MPHNIFYIVVRTRRVVDTCKKIDNLATDTSVISKSTMFKPNNYWPATVGGFACYQNERG